MQEADKAIKREVRTWLRGEVAAWQQEGIIDSGQAEVILSRYPERSGEEEAHKNGFINVLAITGSLLVGIGIILFFAANWQVIPKWVKVLSIFSGIILSYVLGYYLAFAKGSYPRVGRGLIFLGSVLYGSGIWLIAQIFHISSHYPGGVLLWLVGILPIAYICRSSSVLTESALLLILWNVMEQSDFGQYNFLFLLLAGLILMISYKMKNPWTAGITIAGAFFWTLASSVLSFQTDGFETYLSTVFLGVLLGLFTYTLGNLHILKKPWQYMKPIYNILGLVLFFFALFLTSFRSLNGEIAELPQKLHLSPVYWVILLITACGILGIGHFLKRIEKQQIPAYLSAVSAILTVILFFVSPYLGEVSFTLAANILLFAAVMAFIAAGYSTGETPLINIGLVFFVADVIARYFDFFWDMLDKSVFFIVGGLLLLIGGTLLERQRRKVISGIRGKSYGA